MGHSLLAVLAHPDDEAFMLGGTLAMCADRAIATYVLSATAGDAGRSGGLADSPERLAEIRTRELAASCAFLGVREHALFGYGDGRLAEAPFDELVGRVVERIRGWRPSVVVTFGREGGGNAHRDHRAICRAATAAVLAAGDALCYPEQLGGSRSAYEVPKLYHAVAPHGVEGRDGATFDSPTTTVDIAHVAERKLEAFRLHASQISLLPKLEEWIAANGNAENFIRVLSRVRAPEGVERDLFDGLADVP